MNDLELWRELGCQLRVDAVRASAAAGSGHPTSSMSAADLMAVLLAKHLRYDFERPEDPGNDHLIFSKGHATPLLYAMYKAAGAIDDGELLGYRKRGSRLEGHPTPVLPWVDVATGSLGQGLPIGVGVALAGKRLDRLPYRVWVLTGDGELAEGSMWEAFEHAALEKLDNLVAILDINRLGQAGETMHGWDLDFHVGVARAAGWHAITLDGHDHEAIDRAYAQVAAAKGRPTAIVARTIKGSGVAAVADKEGRHGKPLDDAEAAIRELGGLRNLTVKVQKPKNRATPHRFEATGNLELPRWEVGGSEATRRAYAEALVTIGTANGEVVALDGDVGNSTYLELFEAALPERFFEMYIAEQQMAAAAIGLQVRGWKPFASTFAAFWSRAYDFLRMAAVSRADVRLMGSHAGVSIGEDGPSQMGLEDIASIRAVWGSTVLYPCDANQTARLTAAMVERQGIVYLRTTRGKTPVIYSPDDEFPIGGCRVLRRSGDDRVTLVGAGITVHEALEAYEELLADGIAARVVDLYSVKPIDGATLAAAARETGAFVTAEDHRPEGGLGEAVLAALADAGERPRVTRLAVRTVPGSATPDEQLADAGIDSAAIAAAARRLLEPANPGHPPGDALRASPAGSATLRG